jgi:hypothetical protein
VLEALEIDLRIPSTKVGPILTEAFYLEILEAMAARVVALEALAKRSEGHSEVLAALAERVDALEGEAEEQPEGRDG